ncbi:uroporphyrinogen decarboxylase family protein [Planctomycetota bacterium]
MSIETALKNINLEPAERWGHTEYSLDYHTEYLTERTGVSSDDEHFTRAVRDRFAYDFIWSINNGLIIWGDAGRVTDMGHASYAADGSDHRINRESPFTSPEDVWNFDAVEEYGLPDLDAQVKAYEDIVIKGRTDFPGQLKTGGYYRTIVSGAIASFGWEMLLVGCSDPVKMEKVFDSFFRRTLFFMKAWAETSAEVMIQHDDFVWTSGAFMSPDIYREIIIPRYAEMWKPIHEAGKKVLFCSDGNIMEFAGDIVEAGADGLIFEPCNDFETLVKEFGKTVCLVGSCVDCRDLTFGKQEKFISDVDRTFELLERYSKGAILAVGNHLPSNIPAEMLDLYFDRILPKLEK